MRIKSFLKKLVAIGVAVIFTVTLVGCYDLGDFSDESAYYEAFGEIGLVYGFRENGKKKVTVEDYDVEDYFYNKNTVEDFSYGDDSEDDEEGALKDIPQLAYTYMVIPILRDMNLDSLVLYFNATQTCSLEIDFYLVDALPDGGEFENVKLWGDPEKPEKPEESESSEASEDESLETSEDESLETSEDESSEASEDESLETSEDESSETSEDSSTSEENIGYSDPDESLRIAQATQSVKEGEWVSLLVDKWNGKNVAEIKEGQYLLLHFVNNSGAYTGETPSVAFRVTNLLIRALFLNLQ